LYSSCILFYKFCKCSSWFVFVSSFPLLHFFVFDAISYKIFPSFFSYLYFYTNSQLLAFVNHLLRKFVSNLHLKKLRSITIFFHSTILKNIFNKKLLNCIIYLFSHLLLCCLHLLFSSDVDLLWSQHGSHVYLKLCDFSSSLQVYVKANYVDDVANAKPFYLQML